MRWKLSRKTYTTQYRNNVIFPVDVTDFINIPICQLVCVKKETLLMD